MYSFVTQFDSLNIKDQVRAQIFSLLWNVDKIIFSEGIESIEAHIELSWYNRIADTLEDIWSTPHKKFIGYLAILCSSLMITPPETSFAAPTLGEKTFIVTAYYSPLPGQSFYLKGNLEAEKRLNGNGTNGASGAPVFAGMIAAPKSYDFGTQIFFPGLGLGRVEDRGGAIVDAWGRGEAHDRIDIWMGQGEPGMRRAMLWWRREIKGTIVSNGSDLNRIDFRDIDTGRINLADFPTPKKVSRITTVTDLPAEALSAFADLGYTPDTTSVVAMLKEFQLDHGVITSQDETWAWVFGPKTRATLKSEYEKYTTLKSAEKKAVEKARQELLDERWAWESRYSEAESLVSAIGYPRSGDRGPNILALQTTLKTAGFYRGKPTGIMAGSTIVALKKYQKSRKLAPTGLVDSYTQAVLTADIIEG
jgi:Putative peptidoglycan binding domain